MLLVSLTNVGKDKDYGKEGKMKTSSSILAVNSSVCVLAKSKISLTGTSVEQKRNMMLENASKQASVHALKQVVKAPSKASKTIIASPERVKKRMTLLDNCRYLTLHDCLTYR